MLGDFVGSATEVGIVLAATLSGEAEESEIDRINERKAFTFASVSSGRSSSVFPDVSIAPTSSAVFLVPTCLGSFGAAERSGSITSPGISSRIADETSTFVKSSCAVAGDSAAGLSDPECSCRGEMGGSVDSRR